MPVKAYGAYAGDKPLQSIDITRRAPGVHDVLSDIKYCEVCHSDLHQNGPILKGDVQYRFVIDNATLAAA